MIPVQKALVWYTLLRNPPNSLHQLENGHPRRLHTHLVAAGGVPLPLLDDHGLKVLTLGHLSLDVLDQVGEVWNILSLVSIWQSHIGW